MDASKPVGLRLQQGRALRPLRAYYGANATASRPRRAAACPGPADPRPMMATLALLDGCRSSSCGLAATFGWVHRGDHWRPGRRCSAQALRCAVRVTCIALLLHRPLRPARGPDPGLRGPATQAFGVAFILLAGFYTAFPGTRIADGVFFSCFLLIVGALLPIRALSTG